MQPSKLALIVEIELELNSEKIKNRVVKEMNMQLYKRIFMCVI